jgi:hypothetical protein
MLSLIILPRFRGLKGSVWLKLHYRKIQIKTPNLEAADEPMKHVGNGPELMADLAASSPGEDTSPAKKH